MASGEMSEEQGKKSPEDIIVSILSYVFLGFAVIPLRKLRLDLQVCVACEVRVLILFALRILLFNSV